MLCLAYSPEKSTAYEETHTDSRARHRVASPAVPSCAHWSVCICKLCAGEHAIHSPQRLQAGGPLSLAHSRCLGWNQAPNMALNSPLLSHLPRLPYPAIQLEIAVGICKLRLGASHFRFFKFSPTPGWHATFSV